MRSTAVITFLDAQGIARYQSPSIRQVLGYSPDELVGRNMFDFVHPDDRSRALAQMMDHRASPHTDTQRELRFRHKDGTWRDLEILTINALDDPELHCLVSVSRDITARKRFERELERSESQLRSLVGGLPLIAYACDMQGRFTLSEGGALAKIGLAPGAAVGQSAFELYRDVPALIDALRRGLAGESVRYVSNAAGVTFDNLHTPYFDDQGSQIGVMGLAIDITERSRLEAELSRAHRLDAVGRVAGGVAHDFNNLLTVILGNAQGALDLLPADSEAAVAARDIVVAAEQAADLTQHLLAFASRQRVDPRLTDLTELVSATASMLRRIIRSNVRFEVNLDSAGVAVLADPGQLEQVLVNLVLNARDATPTGMIRIHTRRLGHSDRPPELRGTLVDVPLVVIEVADTGHGMDPETLEHIFEPFYTTKPHGKGTGLGLASSMGIVRQSGGELLVDSTLGQGSTFRVILPVADQVVPATPDRPEREGIPRGTETLLLVEDNPLVGDIAAAALAESGYSLLRASDGVDALRVFADHPGRLDGLITDLVMPHMGGAELADRLRAVRPDLPVLFLSGAADFSSTRAQPGRHLAKPFRPDALRQAVRKMLDDRQPKFSGHL